LSDESNDDKPEANKGIDYVLAGLAFLVATVWGGITDKNASDGDNANLEIANWTRVVGKWTRGLVIVGAIVGGLTIMVLGLQTCILNNQLVEMRDENRAWIAPKMMQIGEITSGHETALLLTYGNIGKQPAFKTGRIAEKYAAMDPSLSKPDRAMNDFIDTIEANTAEGSCKTKLAERYLGTIFPGPPESYSVHPTAPPEWADKILQNLTLIIRGCFHYETMGIDRYTGYCFWHNSAAPNKENSGGMRFCPTGNEAN
jgi:hypothetical protein